MKYGFMLIELIVATLIASMIGTLLLTALSQATRFQRSVDLMVDTSLRVGIASHQLEKDFMGAFIPTQAQVEKKEDKKETAEKAGGEKKEGKESQEKQATGEKETKVKKPAEKPIEKIFYGTNKDNHLDILTFITNNPLTVFVGKDVGVVKPKVVRVQYSLKPENEKEKKSDTFVLMRQESTELDLAKYTNVRSYELIGGIKECTVTYTARIKKEDEAKKAAAANGGDKDKGAAKGAGAQKEKVQYEYKTMPEWVSEQKEEAGKKQSDQEEAPFPRIPYMMEIKMVLWDMQHNNTHDCVLSFMLPTDFSVTKKEKKDKKEKKTEQKGEAAKKETGDKDTLEKQIDMVNSVSKNLGNITKLLSKM